MSSVVVSALKMTLGLFLDEARRSLNENLKDGDLNSQQLRGLIMSNMESIKTRIDGLARRELLSSASFIEEGLFLLNDLLDKLDKLGDHFTSYAYSKQRYNASPIAAVASFLPSFDDVFDYVVRIKSRVKRSDKEAATAWAHPDTLNFNEDVAKKLIGAVSELKMSSIEQFKSAMESFKNAHTRATDEFFNESLSLQDRVMAAKLRIQTRLLLSLENPDSAKVCKEVYLKELHGMPAVVEIFRYDLEGGLLSKFNKAERHELVQSISLINFVLFRFLNHFTKERVIAYDWPLIQKEDWMYNPLIPDETVLTQLQHTDIDVPNLVFFKPIHTQFIGIDPKLVTINSKGELILFRQQTDPDVCELLKVSGNDANVFYTFPEFTLVSFLVVDDADFVYVFADNVKSGVPMGYLMYDVLVFDPEGSIGWTYKHFLLIDGSIVLAPTPRDCEVALCIPDEVLRKKKNVQGEVDIRNEEGIQGEVDIRNEEGIQGEVDIRSEENIRGEVNTEGKISGQINKQDRILVEIKMWESTLATITDRHEVVAIEQFGHHVRVFEKDGRFVREFDLHERDREACVGITFNSLRKEIVVVSRVESGYFLSTYLPGTGERRHNVRLAHICEECQEIQVTSHCRGSMALVTKEYVLYL